MPTIDIIGTALSALIFFCFPVAKERRQRGNYDLKLVNRVTCTFFHKLPCLIFKAVYNLIAKQAMYRMQQNLQISCVISLQASNSQTKVSCPQCHITELNAQTRLSCLPVLLYAQFSEHARDRQSVLNYKPGRKLHTHSGARGVLRVAGSLFFPVNQGACALVIVDQS